MANGKADQLLIEQLVAQHGGGENAEIVQEMIRGSLRLLDDKADRLDVKLMAAALRELRYASKVFTPYRAKRKVTVFGSARTVPDAEEYQQAVAFGKAVVARGYMVIT